jgi:hypothetical protein
MPVAIISRYASIGKGTLDVPRGDIHRAMVSTLQNRRILVLRSIHSIPHMASATLWCCGFNSTGLTKYPNVRCVVDLLIGTPVPRPERASTG